MCTGRVVGRVSRQFDSLEIFAICFSSTLHWRSVYPKVMVGMRQDEDQQFAHWFYANFG